MKTQSKLISLLLACNLVTLSLLLVLLLSGFSSRNHTFDQITAHRINIVDADGKTVIAIANRQNIAAPVVGGKVYPISVSEGREYLAGMVFFNQDGDEMGGLLFNSFRLPNGKAAGMGHLSFDRFQDNQVLALQYKENARGVQSGLTVFDRPGNGNFKVSLDLVEQAQRADDQQKADIQARFAAMKAHDGGLGAERVFVGSRNQEAQLALKDSAGNLRARLVVASDGQARLEFLDDQGAVTAAYPPAN